MRAARAEVRLKLDRRVEQDHLVTIRGVISVALGLLAAVVICAITFFNDMVMKGTSLIGNYLPVAVFGGLLLFVLLANPLLGLIHKRLRLRGREVAVAVAIALFACYIPGRGLMHYFSTALMMPHHIGQNAADWQGGPAQIERDDVRDWPVLAAKLRTETKQQGKPLAEAAERLDPKLRARLSDALEAGADSSEDKGAIVESLNALLKDKDLARSDPPPEVVIPDYVDLLRERAAEADAEEEAQKPDAERKPNAFSDKDVAKLNRGLLEVWVGESLRRRRPSYFDEIPPRMLADISSDPEEVPKKFVGGLAEGDERISLNEIPWHVWTRTLLFWVPLVLTVSIVSIALAVIVHRQWSSHEHLPYPTIEFARSLLPDEGGGLSSVFRNRLFWIGAIPVLLIHLNNYVYVWRPDIFIQVKTSFNFTPMLKLFTTFARGGGGAVASPTIYLVPLGIAYFLASDVSFSLGIGTYLFFYVSGILTGYGVALSGGMWDTSDRASLHAGAYFGLFVCLLYTGRYYYLSTLRRGLFLPARGEVEPHVVWAARVFFVFAALFVVQLIAVGVDWQMALLYLLALLVIYVVISRLLAEAGVFFIHAYFLPCAVLWGALGAEAAGPTQLLLLGLVSALLAIDPREAMMPFALSSLKLADDAKARLGRVARWGVVALVLGFAVAIPATLYWQYQRGAAQTGDGWTLNAVPWSTFVSRQAVRNKLEGQGRMRTAEAISGWERFSSASPERRAVVAFGITFGGVLLFAFLRRRFAWWPLHPILFVLLGTYQSNTLAFSFLLGWLVKVLVAKYGGSKIYVRLKPLMIGLIAGEILAAVIPVVVGAVYYFVTGEPPKSFRVLPM